MLSSALRMTLLAFVLFTFLDQSPAQAQIAVYRINTGGEPYTDPSGNVWQSDTGLVNTGNAYWTTSPIAGTTLGPLYQTERYDPVELPEMAYSLPVANGTYLVRLHFAEIYYSQVGQRVFDVTAEGQTVLSNYDIVAKVGPLTATTEEFQVSVSDGALTLEFVHNVENPKISAIEVFAVNQLTLSNTAYNWGHVSVGNTGPTNILVLQNYNTQPITISSLTFKINAGVGHDFAATLGGTQYTGGDTDVSYNVSVTLPVGGTVNVPIVFAPTEVSDNDVLLQFAGNFATTGVSLLGSGVSGTVGDPYLHVVIHAPLYAVDYDGNGVESVTLDGSDSHTHEIGHSITAYQWSENGVAFSNTPVVTKDFPLGNHTAQLQIWDDNQPPRTTTGTQTFSVVASNNVPGALDLYYNGGENLSQLLDNVPAQADFGEITPGLSITATNGVIGTSSFSQNVMLRLLAQVDLNGAGDYQFQAQGGFDRRLFIDGTLVSGPVSLAAGRHNVEARFAINTLTDMPVQVTYALAGNPQTPIDITLITHDESSLAPIVNLAPTTGLEQGGESVILEGLGFFPADQVVVHWGTVDISGANLVVTPTMIGLLAPPGAGLVTITVETPNGVSKGVFYNYTATGPRPVQFTLSTLDTTTAPTQADWGADGRLYVAGLNGVITAYSFDDNYQITDKQFITPLAGLTNNQILGIAFNPHEPPDNFKIYVSHSQLFANGGTCFTGSSPYSGQVSAISVTDFSTYQPIITGLPVSNHDHGINGMQFDDAGNLLFNVGGCTNAGIPDCNMGDLPESPLTSGMMKAWLSKSGFNGIIRYYETLSGNENSDQVYGGIVDVGPGIDVSVYAAGMRNPFDLVYTTSGRVYTTDNGPNSAFGDASISSTTQAFCPDDSDELDLIASGGYYGHPNRNRGRYDDRQNLYHPSTDQAIPGVFTQRLTSFYSSTDGITEYRSQTFAGAMQGELIAQKWGGQTFRVKLASDGKSVVSNTLLPVAMNCLDVVNGPGGVIIGTDYSGNKLMIATPYDPGAVGLNAYDITPWRAPGSSGMPFVIGGVGFGTLADTSVTIGGLAAQLTSVSPTRIRGIIPANPTAPPDLVDVIVTVNGSSQLLPKAFKFLQAPGSSAGAAATVVIDPLPNSISDSSTINAGSFQITNQSTANQKISRVRIDLGTAIFPDMVYDPFGKAGDTLGKPFTVDSDPGVGLVAFNYLKPNGLGYSAMDLTFTNFEPGKSLTFSIDVDPTSIQGAAAPGPNGSGNVSGLELAGATVTVEYSNGTVHTSQLYRIPDSVTGSRNTLMDGAPPQPAISVLGLGSTPAQVNVADQTVHVSGPAGSSVQVLVVEGGLYTSGVPGGGYNLQPYEANTAVAVREYSATIATDGTVDVPVTLSRSSSNDGYNYIIAVLKDSTGRTSLASQKVVLQLVP